jgi:DNA-binding YbaB/EbfC family protein
MKGMPGSMAQLMKQANQMQMKMKKVQEEISKMEFDGTAGGGAVTVKVNGDSKILSLTIDPEVMKAGDVEMLQDLILAAGNDAIKLAKDTSSKEMEKVTGGVGIPGF